MSAPPPDLLASASASGYADGLGRRTIAFDRQCGGMLERLVVRPELAAFEASLAQRVLRVMPFDDERFARVREIARDPDTGAVVVVSEFVAGDRLSDLLQDAAAHRRDESGAPGIDVALGFLLQVLPALSALHARAGVTHGAVAPGRVLLTATGQIVLTDYVFAHALQRLQFSRHRLWEELGLAMPQIAGPARFDVASDLGQAALAAVMLAIGRPLRREEFPNRLRALVMDVAEIAQIRVNAAFADNLRRLLERMLPLPGRRAFGCADDATAELTRIAGSAMGVDACRNAVPLFVAEVAALSLEPPAVNLDLEVEAAIPVAVSSPADENVLPAEAPRLDIPYEEPPQLDPVPVEAQEVEIPFEPPVVIAAQAEPEPAPSVEAAEFLVPHPEPEPVVVAEAAPLAAPEPAAAPDPVEASEPAAPEPPEEPPAPPQPEPVVQPPEIKVQEPPPPSPRRKRGRGGRDKLRSVRTPPPAPVLPPPPPAVAPARPVAPVGFAPPTPMVPPPPLRISAPDPSPYIQAVRAEAWQPSPATAPAAVALAPASIPATPVATPPPAIGFATAAPLAPVRIKPEPPRSAAPRQESRARLDDYPAAGFLHAAPERGSRVPWKLLAAAVVLVAGGLVGGRAYLNRSATVPEGDARTSTPTAPAPAPAPVAKTGTIVIETQPAGARVLLDGAAAGETPLTLSDVAPGRHVLTFVTSSATVRRAVRVEAGKTLTLDVPVYSGFLAIFAPIVLHVSENGRALGTTEQARLMLPPGRHELTLTNRELGYSAVQAVEIEPGKEQTLNVDPRGAVSLNAVPWAEVFIDGQRAGETPIANLQVPLGTREFVFKHPQYGERKITTTVTGNAPAALSVDLTKPSGAI